MTEADSVKQIWDAALGELQIQVNRINFSTWLEKTTGLSYQDKKFSIGVPNTFVAEYLKKNQRALIEKVLTGITRQEVQVQFQVDETAQGSPPSSRKREKQPDLPLFNPKYTFSTFVVSSTNQLAFAAAQGVANDPGHSYNPLFIHGGPGLGKTHLLQAIGHTARASNMKVLYVSAEQYTNELINSLRQKKTEDFREKYRSADMLLVDDIQFFSGKNKTGENFFHTFNILHNNNRQIAVTSDCPPKSIPSLPDRLRSRLEWGLVTDIQPPDFETRLSILKAKRERENTDTPDDVLEYIALQIHQNIRTLEGALNRIVAHSKLIRKLITPELAAQALRDIADNTPKLAPVTPNLIIEAVVNSFKLTPADLIGRKRDEGTALARQVAMYLIRQETDYSLAQIGAELGGRSPATISYAYQKIANDMNNDSYLRRKVFDIQKSFLSPEENPTTN